MQILNRINLSPQQVPHMILHGPGGTGKSYVIGALKHFAALWKISSKLLICASTGIASILIGGKTYHSALKLRREKVGGDVSSSSSSTTGTNNQPPQKVLEYFMQLEVLVIDEMSMVGQKADRKIDETCRRLTGRKNERYGGITIVYCGDYAQLPPVLDSPMYSSEKNPIAYQSYVDTFQTAISLTKNHRFPDPQQAAVMDQCRLGKLTSESVALLNSRVTPVPDDSNWYATACRTNKARSQIIRQNMIQACQAYHAGELTNRVIQIDAEFSSFATGRGGGVRGRGRSRGQGRNRGGRGGSSSQAPSGLNSSRIHQFLASQPDDQLKHLPATLHVYVGMHVIVTKNISLSLGQGNGTLGVVTGFVWPPEALLSNDTSGSAPASAASEGAQQVLGRWEKIFPGAPDNALVFVPSHPPNEILIEPLIKESVRKLAGTQFRLVPSGMFPVDKFTERVSVPFSLLNSGSGGSINATMRQFPLLCADALTIHKLQGQTCKYSIYIPNWSGVKMQEGYVAITRVESINRLYFGEPISEVLRLNWKLPIPLQKEMERLTLLSENLISRLGPFCQG
jgi:hypothetical protein